MTYQGDFTLSTELLEQIAAHGFDKLPALIRVVFNAAMTQSADVVLVDTPPVLAVTDAAILAPALDGVLLVVRPGKTHTSSLRQTLEQLRQVKANVIGVVLNDVSTRGSSYGYRYKYYRNYSAYQSYYVAKHKGRKSN